MSQPIKLKSLTLVALVLAWFAVLPSAPAVSPAPDGGYAGFNTAEGTNALFSLTTGVNNTANGFQALFSNTTGRDNTATGESALYHNSGNYNTATGDAALSYNHSGKHKTAMGA